MYIKNNFLGKKIVCKIIQYNLMSLSNWNPFANGDNVINNTGFKLVLKPNTPNEHRFRSYITTKYVKSLRDTGCMIVMIEAADTGSPNGIFILSRNVKSEQGNVVALCPYQRELQVYWNPHEHPSIQVIPKVESVSSIVCNVRVIQP